MSQRAIEVVVGRLITDEGFRQAFVQEPRRALDALTAQGMSLTATEMRALMGTRVTLWGEIAEQIAPDLQKASLRGRLG